jgi:anaerobic selenocysteine-containing dehydrogenase
MPGVALAEYAHSAGIIVWGVNPSVSGIHLMPALQEAQRNGAWLAVVDPRRTGVAQIADLHLPVRPGTDLPVALSIIRWLFDSGHADRDFLATHATGAEELQRRAAAWSFEAAANVADVESSAIAELAERYAAANPAVVRGGWGMERNRNGGSAVAAVLALPAVAGKFGVRAGGYTMSNTGAWTVDAASAAAHDEVETRVINMNRAGEALLAAEPPIKALFVYNCNPAATLPSQDKVRRGLSREDLFTVVFDQVMTDTARYADIVLPATTFLERGELARGYAAYVLHRSEAVVEPVGESRSNHEVFADLCARAGLARDGDPNGEAEIVDAILRAAYDDTGAAETLEDGGIVLPEFGDKPVQFVDVFPRTADGKVHLVPESLDREAVERGGLYHYEAEHGTVEHPLALISPAHKLTVSSTFGQLRRHIVPVELHPEDAAARSIDEGAEVRVFNESGEVRCTATINPALRVGVACVPKGTWDHNTRSGNTINVLVPDTLTDISGGACFNDTRVQVVLDA